MSLEMKECNKQFLLEQDISHRIDLWSTADPQITTMV